MFFILTLLTVINTFIACYAIIFFICAPFGILKFDNQKTTTKESLILFACSGAYLVFYFALMNAMWG